MINASLELTHKICRRCGTTAGLTRAEIAAGYKCLRCGGFFDEFVPMPEVSL